MESIVICCILMAVCLAVCALFIHRSGRRIQRHIDLRIAEQEDIRRKQNREVLNFTGDTLKEYDARIKNLEEGLVPDFEQAKEAAKAVNDFNKGLSAIMGYDPFEARKKVQEERGNRE